MTTRSITSIADFLAARREDSASYGGAIWYRGHADASWPLLPGYLRNSSTVSETTLLTRFRQSAAMLTDRLPASSFEWLFVMQHYGVPTRLLDWTESPLVALYFAVNDESKDSSVDAAIWCLRPTELNKKANIVDPVEDGYIPSFEDDLLQGYSIESVRIQPRLTLNPVATIATRNNARIQSQMGTFTIHHNQRIAINDVGDGSHTIKYIIPGDDKARLIEELNLLGVSRFSMFPELESVGRILKDSLA